MRRIVHIRAGRVKGRDDCHRFVTTHQTRIERLKFMTGAVVLVAIALFFLSRSNSFLLIACCMGSLAIGAAARWVGEGGSVSSS